MVLPVGDRSPTRRAPVVTVVLIAVNVGVFLLFSLQLSGCELSRFVFQWAAIPRELLSLSPLDPAALPPRLAECVAPALADKSVLTSIVSSMFLHGSLFHLLFNMLFLWVFGNNVEDRLGHGTYLVYYLAGGIVAAYAFAILNPSQLTPLLGASGAIAAVLGGYLVMFPRAQVHTYVPFPLYLLAVIIPGARITGWFLIFAIVTLPAWLVLGFWFVSQVTSANEAAAAGIAFEAHIAGFVAGLVFTLLLGGTQPRRRTA
ncbi:MAG: rhomboid family intramembrane serine protease [Nitriliruptorales bacterium]